MSYEESVNEPFLDDDENHPDDTDIFKEKSGSKRRKCHTQWLISFLILSHLPTIITILFLLLRLSKYTLEHKCAHPELVPCKCSMKRSGDSSVETSLG